MASPLQFWDLSSCKHAKNIIAFYENETIPGRLLQGGRGLPQDLPLQGLQRRGIILLATALIEEAARGPPTAAAAAATTTTTPARTRGQEEVTRTDGEGGGGLDEQGQCVTSGSEQKRARNLLKIRKLLNRHEEAFVK